MSYPAVSQSIAWFWDLFQRKVLDLEPPYQRRSVWNQRYREDFVDTITLQYPTPAIFLYADIEPTGRTVYHVVDGKQRLLTIFGYIDNAFVLPERAEVSELRGKYFRDLSDEQKRAIFAYTFSVINLPNSDEKIINDIFNRINKNVAKLSRQELRHARYDGIFIRVVESISDLINRDLPDFPRIAEASRKQMRDIEFASSLCLLLEEGPKSYSADDLDAAFSDRDDDWEAMSDVETRVRAVIGVILDCLRQPDGEYLRTSRLRNQADFYSLFGAVDELIRENELPPTGQIATNLRAFVDVVANDEARSGDPDAQQYFDAARSASNDAGPRKTRIEKLRKAILGPVVASSQG